ncbi:MAG: helix-turn-helix domain-containing protein [Sphingomonas sp.]|nr:helix-turn-helix domain-containing protein [Sphingomonas sp.]
MDEDKTPDQASLFPKSTGDKLREAREALGLTLADIASRTRVPMRHLEAIENGDYGSLPSPTYTIGFAKTYARAVGLDEKAIAAEVRNNPQLPLAPVTDYEAYQPSDGKRVPSFGLAAIAGLIAGLVLIAAILWYGTNLFRGSEEPVAPPVENTIAAAPEATPTPVSGGQVALTATDSVWLKVYDATGKTLFEKTMAAGERYDVPQDANGPMINIGRPDKIQVTVNGSAVAPLGDGKVAIKDVPISAAALQARGSAPTPAATPTSAPTPVATATPKTTKVPPAFQPVVTPTPDADATPAPATTPAP